MASIQRGMSRHRPSTIRPTWGNVLGLAPLHCHHTKWAPINTKSPQCSCPTTSVNNVYHHQSPTITSTNISMARVVIFNVSWPPQYQYRPPPPPCTRPVCQPNGSLVPQCHYRHHFNSQMPHLVNKYRQSIITTATRHERSCHQALSLFRHTRLLHVVIVTTVACHRLSPLNTGVWHAAGCTSPASLSHNTIPRLPLPATPRRHHGTAQHSHVITSLPPTTSRHVPPSYRRTKVFRRRHAKQRLY